MNIIERLEQIDNFFESLTVEEFDKKLEKAGVNKYNQDTIKSMSETINITVAIVNHFSKDTVDNNTFEIGERVISVVGKTIGEIGTIIYRNKLGIYLVEYDKNVDGHDGDGRCEYGYGYWEASNGLVKLTDCFDND